MNLLGIVLTVVTVTLLMKYLVNSSKKEPIIDESGKMILRINKAFAVIGYIVVLAAIFIIIIACLGTVKSQSDLLIVICLTAFFALLGIILILYSHNFKVEVNEEKIIGFGMFGKSKEIKWNDIKKLKFNKTSMELIVISDTAKIKIYPHLIGFPNLVNLIKQKLDASMYQEVLQQIEIANNKFLKM
jgi:hypothetical protein